MRIMGSQHAMPFVISGFQPGRCAAWHVRVHWQSENVGCVRRSHPRYENCGLPVSQRGAAMKFWIGPLGAALISGAYGMLKLGEQWNIGGEHAFRASGTLLAYMLIGAFIGLIISGLLFSATEGSGSDSPPEETKRLPGPPLLRRGSPKPLDTAVDTEWRCPVS